MTITDIHKQIGNAVPVPLAVALAKGLLDVLMDQMEAESHGVIKSEFNLVEELSETEIEQRQTKIKETEAPRSGKQDTGRRGGSMKKAIYIIDDSDSDWWVWRFISGSGGVLMDRDNWLKTDVFDTKL
jgi:hypothetical protein